MHMHAAAGAVGNGLAMKLAEKPVLAARPT